MTFDWTLPTRSERYVFELLNLRRERIRALRGVLSCDLDWSIYNKIRGGGDLTVRADAPLVWSELLVRPWLVASNSSGTIKVPLLTGLCEVPDEDWTSKGIEVGVRLVDRTLILDQTLLTDAFSLPAGTITTTAIRDILTTLGISGVSITASGHTLSSARNWLPEEDSGLSWLSVLNDLLDAAGYFSVWADPLGVLQFRPYTLPSARVASARVADDGLSNRYKDLRRGTGRPLTPNRWTFWSKAVEGDPGVAPVKYTVTNDDPEHPFSTVRLDRVVDAPPQFDVEGDVASRAIRARAEGMADQQTFEVPARFVPVAEHEVVELAHEPSGTSTTASVAGRSLSCAPGPLPLTLRLRKVA